MRLAIGDRPPADSGVAVEGRRTTMQPGRGRWMVMGSGAGGKAKVSLVDGDPGRHGWALEARSMKAGGAAALWAGGRGVQSDRSIGLAAAHAHVPVSGFGTTWIYWSSLLRLAAAGWGFEHVLTCEGNVGRRLRRPHLPLRHPLCYRCVSLESVRVGRGRCPRW